MKPNEPEAPANGERIDVETMRVKKIGGPGWRLKGATRLGALFEQNRALLASVNVGLNLTHF